MKTLIVIPARYASSRFPGKPLAKLRDASGTERSLIELTWRAACEVAIKADIIVATDDDRIRAECERIGARTVMTSSTCRNGTERCAEVIDILPETYDLVVNLQGDAPLTPPWFVEDLVAAMATRPDADMATPVLRCDGRALASFREDRANGRVGGTTAVFDNDQRALYFSKEVLPYTKEQYLSESPTPVFHHVGVYAYRPDALRSYMATPETQLERLEGLEQLRFLTTGHHVLCVEVEARGRVFWELNNPEDVSRIEAALSQKSKISHA